MINEGISFSLWQSVPLWVVALGWLLVLMFVVAERRKMAKTALAIILIGGTFNIVERFLYGGVVDNFSLFGVLYNNLADYFIFAGLCLYGYTSFVRRR